MVTEAFKVAVTLPIGKRDSPPTKKEIKAALRDRGLKLSLVNDVLAIWKEAVDVRRNAERNRLIRRFGCMPQYSNMRNSTRRRTLVFAGTVSDRLYEIRRNAVLQSYLRTYTTSRKWGSERVELVTDPALVGISQNRSSHQSGQWLGTSTHTVIRVPVNWRIRVPEELWVCNGMMTLDASQMDSPRHDVTVWRARWGVQGRGFAVAVVDGYIAGHNGEFYHSDRMDAAISGVVRKARIARQTPQDKHKSRVNSLRKLVSRDPLKAVSRLDAYAVGACQYGVESWCNLVGLNDQDTATLTEVLEGYLKHPAPEARLVILAATKRLSSIDSRACQ